MRYTTDLTDTEWNLISYCFPKPAATGRPRKHSYRELLNAIFYLLRTGCQWKALTPATHGCCGSSAHRYFQQWVRYNVFERFWTAGLQRYDEFQGIDWEWLSMDGAMTKAPLGGEKKRTKPN